jgi:hypothetical protein
MSEVPVNPPRPHKRFYFSYLGLDTQDTSRFLLAFIPEGQQADAMLRQIQPQLRPYSSQDADKQRWAEGYNVRVAYPHAIAIKDQYNLDVVIWNNESNTRLRTVFQQLGFEPIPENAGNPVHDLATNRRLEGLRPLDFRNALNGLVILAHTGFFMEQPDDVYSYIRWVHKQGYLEGYKKKHQELQAVFNTSVPVEEDDDY